MGRGPHRFAHALRLAARETARVAARASLGAPLETLGMAQLAAGPADAT